MAIEHGSRAHVVFPERHDGKLEREPPGLPDAALHRFRHLPQVRVTMRELAPRIADADNRASLVGGFAKAFSFKGRAPEPAIQLGGIKPIATAVTGMRRGRHNGRSHGVYCGLREMSAAIIPLSCAYVCRFSYVAIEVRSKPPAGLGVGINFTSGRVSRDPHDVCWSDSLAAS